MQSFTSEILNFYIGKFQILNSEVAVPDLLAINVAYQQLAIALVLGVSGGGFLVKYEAMIDDEQ